MIRRFNRGQIVAGIVGIFIGFLFLFLAWLLVLVCTLFTLAILNLQWNATLLGSCLALAIAGCGAWYWLARREGARVFKDHAFYDSLQLDLGIQQGQELGNDGIVLLGDVFAQIFFAGPRQICTGIAHICARLPSDPDLENRMREVLGLLQTANHWETAQVYRDQAQAVGALIRCGLVDFSTTKSSMKAAPAQGA
jgi:uncharacterized membrane protein YbhN (UPF0104 family)